SSPWRALAAPIRAWPEEEKPVWRCSSSLCYAALHEAPNLRRRHPRNARRPSPGASGRSLDPGPAPKEDLVPVAIDTSLGRIVVALDRGRAPVTTANFLHYVDTHRLDGENFYRAMHMGEGGLIQFGVRSDVRKLFPKIADEPSSKTGIKNVAGAISMARNEPNSAQADF